MTDSDNDPVDVMDTWLQSRLEELHTTIPGTIQSYNASTRLAVVVPSVRLNSLHGDIIEIKPITHVPVVWPGCSRFALIPANLQQGDGVILHFSEAALGNWLNGAGTQDAEDQTRFSLHDCIAVPGLHQVAKVPTMRLGTAEFGLAGDKGEVIGGAAGKLDLHNDVSTLRAELERAWSAIIALHTQLSTAFTALAAVSTSAAALVPGVGGATPLAAAFTTAATAQTTAQGTDTVSKALVKGLLA